MRLNLLIDDRREEYLRYGINGCSFNLWLDTISEYTEDPLPAKVVFASIWDLPPTDNFSWLLKIVQDAYDVVSGEVDDVEINNNTPVPIVSIHCSLKQMPRVYALLGDYIQDWDVPYTIGATLESWTLESESHPPTEDKLHPYHKAGGGTVHSYILTGCRVPGYLDGQRADMMERLRCMGSSRRNTVKEEWPGEVHESPCGPGFYEPDRFLANLSATPRLYNDEFPVTQAVANYLAWRFESEDNFPLVFVQGDVATIAKACYLTVLPIIIFKPAFPAMADGSAECAEWRSRAERTLNACVLLLDPDVKAYITTGFTIFVADTLVCLMVDACTRSKLVMPESFLETHDLAGPNNAFRLKYDQLAVECESASCGLEMRRIARLQKSNVYEWGLFVAKPNLQPLVTHLVPREEFAWVTSVEPVGQITQAHTHTHTQT